MQTRSGTRTGVANGTTDVELDPGAIADAVAGELILAVTSDTPTGLTAMTADLQFSNDGVTWASSGTPLAGLHAAAHVAGVFPIEGIRLRLQFVGTTAGSVNLTWAVIG